MKQHIYSVSVKHLADANGNPSSHPAPLEFEVGNHDDILAIVERLKNHPSLAEVNQPAFALGLKLFGEVLLENRSNPLFSEIGPQFGEFMKKLKGR